MRLKTDLSQSSYFENWDTQSQDTYVPQIITTSSSRWHNEASHHAHSKSEHSARWHNEPSHHAHSKSEQINLPPPTKKRRPGVSSVPPPQRKPMHAESKAKRYGLVSHGNVQTEDEAISRLDGLLNNSSAATEDILAAMYNSSWDVASLQRWYQKSKRSPSDLALYKIMFSLRYSPEDSTPT